jgi:1-acyl-sn-glycerol-3-phosphate acyltransferase
MKSGLLPRLFAYVGSINVKRTWRAAGRDIQREVESSDVAHIGEALADGWVITFPQGTTRAFAPGRKGTAHLIKQFRPVVVPIVIDGFRRAFDKKGLFLKKRGVKLKMRFKDPLVINYDDSVEAILDQVMHAIEQSETFRLHPSPEATKPDGNS